MEDLKSYIEDVHDFPKKGIIYKDIQSLFEDAGAFYEMIGGMTKLVDLTKVDYFVGIESRGFILASAIAVSTISGFKMIRKKGKLPDKNYEIVSLEYNLEYGTDTMQMKPGKGNVIIVDDVYATGGTMEAAEKLCKMAGYNVIDTICLLDVGIKQNHNVKCLITY